MLPQVLGYLPILISLTGISFYIREIFRGRVQPNLVSWFAWMIPPFIATFLEVKAGAGLSVISVFMAGFVSLVVIIAALIKKTNYWKITKFDITCGILSIISIFFWILSKNTDISIFFAILADLLAGIPTLLKSWKFPETENAGGYIPAIINSTIALLIIKNWDFSIYSFNLYLMILNILIVIGIYHKKFFRKVIS